MGEPPGLEGWRIYPRNLPLQGYNAYGYDCDAYVEQLNQDAERLFVSGPDIYLKIVDLRPKGRHFVVIYYGEQILTKAEELNPYFMNPRPAGVVRIILVPQEGSSWGNLRISKECMLKLFTALSVFPACIDVLRAFGQRTAASDESYSGFYVQENGDSSNSECAYTVKYPEQHGREGPRDPWSMRQMGVYHQCYQGEDSTFVILHPSISFLRRLKRAKISKETLSWWMVQMMALSAAMENWRWYISDLEKRYTTAKTNAQLAPITNRGSDERLASIDFDDAQDIQVLQDKLSQCLHHLTTNYTILENMQNRRTRVTQVGGQAEDCIIGNLMVEARMEMNRVKSLLKRAEGTQALAQSILDFSCLESLRSNSRTMTELTKLSKKEAEVLIDLSMKASRDNDILKTLALLGLIYLPATLVSSIMGMEYIKVNTRGKKLEIVIEKEMWVFAILVAILLFVTLGSYFLWVRNKQAKRRKNLKRLQWRDKHLTW